MRKRSGGCLSGPQDAPAQAQGRLRRPPKRCRPPCPTLPIGTMCDILQTATSPAWPAHLELRLPRVLQLLPVPVLLTMMLMLVVLVAVLLLVRPVAVAPVSRTACTAAAHRLTLSLLGVARRLQAGSLWPPQLTRLVEQQAFRRVC